MSEMPTLSLNIIVYVYRRKCLRADALMPLRAAGKWTSGCRVRPREQPLFQLGARPTMRFRRILDYSE